MTAKSLLWPSSLRSAVRRVEASPIGYRLASGMAWVAVGSVAARSVAVLTSVVVARAMGKTGLGEMAIIQSTVNTFGTLAGFGLGATAQRYVAELREREPERAGRVIVMAQALAVVTGLTAAAAVTGAAPWLAGQVLNAPHLAGLLRIGALILLLSVITGAQEGALSGFEAFRALAMRSACSAALSLPLVAVLTHLLGLPGALCGLASGIAINLVLNARALHQEARRRRVPLVCRGCLREIGILWKFSLPSFLSGAMVAPVIWMSNAILVRRAGYSEMGIFAAAAALHSAVLAVAAVLGAPLVPVLTSQRNAGNRRLERFNITSTWALGTGACLAMLLAVGLLQRIFGEQFAGARARQTFVLLIGCSAVVLYKQGPARALVAHNMMWWGLASNLSWAAVLVGLVYSLASKGAVGVALAYLLAYIVSFILFVPLYVRRGLVPKETLISAEAAAIWISALAAVLLSVAAVPGPMPAMCVGLAACLCTFAFARLLRANEREAAAP